MSLETEIQAALATVRQRLLAERNAAGHWVGELATSALSTATALSALAIHRQSARSPDARGRPDDDGDAALIAGAVRWLVEHQNADGGWGDTDRSYSNIATTMLCVAALDLAGASHEQAEVLRRAEAYIDQCGGVRGLRERYGEDKTFAVPILTNYALAGRATWREVSPLPFELACLPQSWYRFARLPVVSYAIPALVAIGQARYFHRRPWFLPLRWLRRAAVAPSLDVLLRMQPSSGGYLEAVPLTSFVVMSLASIGQHDHPVTQRGLAFLRASVRPDGSWPIDTNLATWNTTLAVNALATAGDDVAQLDCWPWLLECQHRARHPFTGAEPGGWGWSDLSGAVPDADDTSGALIALAALRDAPSATEQMKSSIHEPAARGLAWLAGLQNRDGGWPTFCRGWGKLPFDRSGADLTAHALRAFRAWQKELNDEFARPFGLLARQATRRVDRAFRYLDLTQHADGFWLPLWFGNQDHPEEANPVYGTAKVLFAYRDYARLKHPAAQAGVRWLLGAQASDGSWGAGSTGGAPNGSIEETALAVEALASVLPVHRPRGLERALASGLAWLVERVQHGAELTASPIGFYFAKLWYYEKLYPLTFALSALGQAARTCSALSPTGRSSGSAKRTGSPPPESSAPSRRVPGAKSNTLMSGRGT